MRQYFNAFKRSQDGSATLEAVLWTPIFLILFGMVTDTSLVFGREAEILRIIQDSNRSLAVGHFQTVQQAKAFISDQIDPFSQRAQVQVQIAGGIITTTVSLPAKDLTSTGLFDAINSLTVTVGASQMSEL